MKNKHLYLVFFLLQLTLSIGQSIKLSQKNYMRLSVPVGVWMAFRGISSDTNMLLNIASIEHDPTEALVKELSEINYDWN